MIRLDPNIMMGLSISGRTADYFGKGTSGEACFYTCVRECVNEIERERERERNA